MTPDKTLSARRAAGEAERLSGIRERMDAQQRAAALQLARDLAARQQQVDDASVLPRVELSDVPPTLPELEFTLHGDGAMPITTYGQGTNGLVYQQLVAPLPAMTAEQLQALPLYTSVLTELGLGSADYLAAQHRQSASVGAINAFTSMRGRTDDEQAVMVNFVLSSKALLRNTAQQAELMHDTLRSARFDESSRVRELISQQRARREQSITGNGHGLAMAAACAGMSPLAALNHRLSGMAGIRSLRALDEQLREPEALAALCARLEEVHRQVAASPIQLLAVAEQHRLDEVVATCRTVWSADQTQTQFEQFSLPPQRQRRGELWLTNTQVNFCARAYPTVPVQHPDAAALTVLGGFLRNGYLHRTIREQGGAYGGGASQDSGIAAFRFYSYRDPRLLETLQDFDASVAWMLETAHERVQLEEAILGVIGSLDRPSSPAGEAKRHFHDRLFGRTHEQREKFRQRILAVTLDDLRRVTDTYLRPELASTAVISNSSQLNALPDLAERLDLTVEEL